MLVPLVTEENATLPAPPFGRQSASQLVVGFEGSIIKRHSTPEVTDRVEAAAELPDWIVYPPAGAIVSVWLLWLL